MDAGVMIYKYAQHDCYPHVLGIKLGYAFSFGASRNSYRDLHDLSEQDDLGHQLRLGTTLPRAPGVRMT